ncbi:hypothetical protein DICSQDRAFT_174487 [Dichomitus squalens LYAD-421 SS1]|uniref:Uncharacterized protein n=1 Tax=Dichomitus squalens (strain LYAD-421) TaxID=732165 RepID=R7SMD5_DICSQ|nr:uncharacterized protein DICSQDRAFT_174487 [Dichomitus squalens LYAD-421 SS1]EJF56900.1 hypothetical protein DICSQDRAFT_174487 [Dichomitus squalens LYAD-421 SS1]
MSLGTDPAVCVIIEILGPRQSTEDITPTSGRIAWDTVSQLRLKALGTLLMELVNGEIDFANCALTGRAES